MTPSAQPHRSVSSTGRMTAVMRSAMAVGPKVLRIAMLEDDTVVEERIVSDLSNVSVGRHEKNTFVVSGAGVPATLRLFERDGERYALNFLDAMGGRVALPTGIDALQGLKAHAKRTRGGAYQIPLTEDSRGILTLGNATFLFQFVAPPPEQPKAQLPVSVMGGASHLDWTTTVIAAFVFLFDFLLVGAIYSDWFDQIIDENVNIGVIVTKVKGLPPAPPVQFPPADPSFDDVTDDSAETETTPKPTEQAKTKTPGPSAEDRRAATMAAATSALDESDATFSRTISAAVDQGSVSDGMLVDSDVPVGSLDAAAASNTGMAAGSTSLRDPRGGGDIIPGARGGLSDIDHGGMARTDNTGTAEQPTGPKHDARIGPSKDIIGTVPADATVARLRVKFRRCYETGLNKNPDISGKVTLRITIGLSGAVESVSSTTSGNLPASVVQCVERAAKSRDFPPPQGAVAVIKVPVSFVNLK